GVAGDHRNDVVQGGGSVDLGLSLAKELEVGTRQHQHKGSTHGCLTAEMVSRTSSGSSPWTTSTPLGPSRAKVSPSMAFLSRASRCIRRSSSRPSGTTDGSP